MKNIQVFKPYIREEAIEAVCNVLRSGWIGCGGVSKQFEQDFQAYLQTDNKCVSVMSATDALEIALQLNDLSPLDEVITTPITFISTNHAILYVGATPVFADVDPTTGCIDPKDIERKITAKTKVIMVVHLSGSSADMESIEAIAEKHNLKIIEDCAHAAGGLYHNGKNKGKKIGSSKNICCFSFQAVKNLPMGDGGMLTLPNEELASKAFKLRWLGIDKDTYSRSAKTGEYVWKYDVPFVGIKSNVNDILCAIGLEQLKYLDQDNNHRRTIAKMYQDHFLNHPNIKLPSIDLDLSSCHFYPIFVDRRDELMTHMRNSNIYCGMHYQRNDKYSNYVQQDLPNAEFFANNEITLPLHLLLTEQDVKFIIHKVKEFYS